MELARMFATLGFKVDQTGLNSFEGALRSLRSTAAKLNAELKPIGTQLDVLKKKASNLNKVLSQDVKTKKLGSNTQESYSRLAKYVERVNEANEGVTKHAPTLITSLENIRAAVHKGANAWERYAKNINAAKEDMRTFKQSISDLRRGTGNVNVRNQYYGGGQGGASRLPSQPQQAQESNSLTMLGALGGGIKGFFRSMSPATALAGGTVSAGFAFKEIVQAGREVQKMQIVMKMASKDTADWNRNLKFVNDTAKEMGVSYVEFGQAFAKMLSATKDIKESVLSQNQKETMFKDLSAYMVAIGSSADDQKGIFRALTQMFTKGKVQAEEMLQMAERGVPAAIEIKKAAMEGLKMTEAQFNKAQQEGKLDPTKLLPIMAKALGDIARKSGAYDMAINSSVAAQQRLTDAWKKFAHQISQGGLDQALGRVFNGLAAILEKSAPFVKFLINVASGAIDVAKGFLQAVVGLIKFLDGVNLLVPAIAVMIINMIRAKAAALLAAGATTTYGAAAALAAKNIAKLTLKLGALLIAFKAFSDIAEANNGVVNWVTTARAAFELLFVTLDIYVAKMKLMWQLTSSAPKNWWDTFTGKTKTTSFAGFIDSNGMYQEYGKTPVGIKRPEGFSAPNVIPQNFRNWGSLGSNNQSAIINLNVDGDQIGSQKINLGQSQHVRFGAP